VELRRFKLVNYVIQTANSAFSGPKWASIPEQLAHFAAEWW